MKNNRQLIESFKQRIFQSTKIKDKNATLNSLKIHYSIDEIKKILPNIISHPVTKRFVYGMALPKSYKELRNATYSLTASFEHELYWLSLSFFKYNEEINAFIKEKYLFDKLLLKGNYNDAIEKLNEVNEKICYSLWGLENQFIVEEFIGGLKKNKDYLSQFNEEETEALVSLLADFYSNKAEKKLSVFRFYSILEKFLSGLSKGFQQYWSMRLNFLNTNEFSEFTEIISFESKSSIIDRYLNFLRISQTIILNGSVEQKEAIQSTVSKLVLKIDDPLLYNLNLMYNPKQNIVISNIDKRGIEIFDQYTCGNYIEAEKLLKNFLTDHPHDFSFYDVYIKSLFYLNKGFTAIDENNSIMNEILEDLFNIYEKNDNTGSAISRLMKYVNVLDSLSISPQIFSYLQNFVPYKKVQKTMLPGLISSISLNPLLYKSYKDFQFTEDFLGNLLELFPSSATINFHYNYVRQIIHKNAELLSYQNVPDTRVKFYYAKALKKLNYIDDSIKIYEELLENNRNKISADEITVKLFDCYKAINNYDKCIELYINSYLNNNNNTLRFEIGNIPKNIEKAKFKNVVPTIKLPLFFYITKQDNHSTNIAARIFLKQLKIQKTPELVTVLDLLDPPLLIEFLLKVCTPEVLKYSTYFKSTKEILNERLEIYQLLIKIDPDNTKQYKTEIRKLSQDLAVIEGIRQVDESKIYVDERGLISTEFNEIENNFNRYIEISNIIKEKPYFFIDLVDNKKFLFKSLNLEQNQEDVEKARISQNFKFSLFKELFGEILNRFLFSNKYGLDSYLSTRIRHGTLLGQLRSQFQKQFLITQKDKLTDKYYKNEYWNNNLSIDNETKDKIQELLSNFSFSIDSIANNLKEKYIQIKIPIKNPEGLFDYDFSISSLNFYFDRHFNKIEDYNLFVKGVLTLIWEKTRTNLEIIQNIIGDKIKSEIIENLIKLERDLKNTVDDTADIQELINNITNCRTLIISEIDKIADWFKLRESITSDFKIDKVIDTSIEITKKTSQINKINVHYHINSDTLIRGEFFIHFFDLMRIFLENAVSYSGLQPNELQITLNVEELNEKLSIEILNNLSSSKDVQTLQNLFYERRKDLDQPEWNTEVLKTEIGGTGFFKAKKILETNMRSESNFLFFSIDDDKNVKINMNIDLLQLKV